MYSHLLYDIVPGEGPLSLSGLYLVATSLILRALSVRRRPGPTLTVSDPVWLSVYAGRPHQGSSSSGTCREVPRHAGRRIRRTRQSQTFHHYSTPIDEQAVFAARDIWRLDQPTNPGSRNIRPPARGRHWCCASDADHSINRLRPRKPGRSSSFVRA